MTTATLPPVLKPTTNPPKLSDMKPTEIIEMERYLCRHNLKYLCTMVLGFKDWDVCHDRLADFLRSSKKLKRLILMPREHLKTSVITIGYGIQKLLNNFDSSILLMNVTQPNAESFLAEMKDYLTRSQLPRLFGKFESAKWNETEIIINQRRAANKTPSVSVAGADKNVTSQHYDTIFPDDIVNRQTISTEEQIVKTRKVFSDLQDLLAKPNGELFVVGTRWDGADIYGTIMKEFAAEFDILNLQATDTGSVDGKVIFPKKFTTDKLRELLKLKGSYEFYLQYMNQVTSPENMIFKPPVREWRDIPEGTVVAITVDPAISERSESCDAVVMASGVSPAGQIFALEYMALKGDEKMPSKMVDRIFEYAFRFRNKNCKTIVGIESNGYQQALAAIVREQQIKRGLVFEVQEIRQIQDKAARIIGLQPFWERGDILLKPGMVELADQFRDFRKPLTTKCDILDALSMRLQIYGTQTVRGKVFIPQEYR